MSKKLANKKTKRLLTEAQIKEQSLPKSDFTTSWQGRLFIRDVEKSFIAKQISIKLKGEYAIKVR
jgi:RNA polymerase subunit RPABC4/transcription elongation factor Spt4